ncbi:MAG: hypothetical protein F6K41_29125 [Symploca sp. SIO3E6]|nr:hypothetical protein [Caldora sp. SIO3E6]
MLSYDSRYPPRRAASSCATSSSLSSGNPVAIALFNKCKESQFFAIPYSLLPITYSLVSFLA